MTTLLNPAPATAPPPAASRPRQRLRRAAALLTGAGRRTAAIAVLLAVWETAPRTGLVDRLYLPPISEVLAALGQLVATGQLAEHLSASLVRSLSGFAIAAAVAIPLGLLIGWYTPVAQLLGPLLEVFRNTAALALLPVFVLLLGLGETSKIALVAWSCTWPILLNTISGVRTVDPLLVKSARSMGLSSPRLFQKVILPAAVPTIFTGIRLAGAFSILVLVAAEMVGARAGLGYLINAAQFNFQIPQMYAGIVTISALGLVINAVLQRLERRFSRWRPQT